MFTDIPALNLPMVHHEQNQYVLKTNFLYLFHYRSVDNNYLQDGPEYNCWKCDYKVVLKTEQKDIKPYHNEISLIVDSVIIKQENVCCK